MSEAKYTEEDVENILAKALKMNAEREEDNDKEEITAKEAVDKIFKSMKSAVRISKEIEEQKEQEVNEEALYAMTQLMKNIPTDETALNVAKTLFTIILGHEVDDVEGLMLYGIVAYLIEKADQDLTDEQIAEFRKSVQEKFKGFEKVGRIPNCMADFGLKLFDTVFSK